MAKRRNFTEKEKMILLSIVENYKNIVENKYTNAVYTSKKEEIWDVIKNEFNAQAEVPRTTKQLNTLYFNLKRKTRQDVAKDNMQTYIESKKQIQDLKKDAAADKKEITKTGGGTYKKVLSDAGAQMLALIGDQIQPLTNSCDSATEYYEICDEQNDTEGVPVVMQIDSVETDGEVVFTQDDALETDSKKTGAKPKQHKPQRFTRPSPLKKKKSSNETSDSLKIKIYTKKLQNCLIDNRNKVLESKLLMKKLRLVDIEIKIKQAELEKLQKEKYLIKNLCVCLD